MYMNEGEKKKKVYKRGDIVTFRLLKKMNYSKQVIELINEANQNGELNTEIINAIELYARYRNKQEKFLENQISGFNNEAIELEKEPVEIEKKENIDESKSKSIINQNYESNDDDAADELFFSTSSSTNLEKPIDEDKQSSGLARAFRSIRRT